MATRYASIVLAVLAVSCAGDGCGCGSAIPGGFPAVERIDNAIQLRVTDSAIQVLEDDPGALVSSILGGEGLTFNVPPSCDDPAICCDGGTENATCGPVEIDLEEQPGDAPRLEIDLIPGGSHIDIVVRARVRSQNPIPFSTTGISCDMSVDTDPGPDDHLRMDLSVDLPIDAEANTTRVEVTRAEVSQLTAEDLTISGDFLCGLGNLDFVKDLVIDQLIGTLEGTMRDTIEGGLCKSCESGDVADCGGFADACTESVCMKDGACLQEIGLSMRGRIASLLSGVSSGQAGSLDVYDVAGGYADTDNGGISAGVLGGLRPAAEIRDRCGPESKRPDPVVVPTSSFFQGNTRPDTNSPFHLGIGIHAHNLDLLSWAGYESGLFCLNIGTRAVALLNTDALGLLFPSIGELTHGRTAQVVLGLRPQNRPDIVLGSGVTSTDPDTGEEVIEEPLLEVSFEQLEIDFFVMVDDQFIRVLTATTNVRLPINLEVDDNGEILPIIGSPDDAFSDVTVSNFEALLESKSELEAKFPLLLGLALPQLGTSLGSFALPELGGVKLRVTDDGIAAIEDETFLAVFAELVPPTSMATSSDARLRVSTVAELVRVNVPDAETFAAQIPDSRHRPVVEFALGGEIEGSDGTPLEWSFRVDNGAWSPYTTANRVRLQRDVFWLQGRHAIDVRARVRGQATTTDRSPVTLHPVIDRIAPRLSLARGPGSVLVIGHDAVSGSRLAVEYQFAGGQWLDGGASLPMHIALGERSAYELTVRLTDEAGNQTMRTLGTLPFHGGGGEADGCQCTAGGNPRGAAGTLLLLLVAGSIALRRRRQRPPWWLAAVLLILPLAAGCSCGGSKSPVCAGESGECLEGEVERGPTGRWSSIAVTADRAVVTGYEQSLGDLVLVGLDTEGAPESYRVVDGVPTDVKPTYQPTTYRGGIVQAGDDVGAWTSVALRDGLAIIAYHDITHRELKLAVEREDGSFHIQVVDGADGAVSAGSYASLHVRADGTPTIAYMALGVDDPDSEGVRNELRYAEASSRTPLSASDWTITAVDGARVSCNGLCGPAGACVSEDPNLGAAGERCEIVESGCNPMCADDRRCTGGVCLHAMDSEVHDLPGGVGLFANNLELTDGTPAIVYYDRALGDLVAATFRGGWTRHDVDAGAGTDTGHAATAIVANDGKVHIAYQDATGDRLLYTTWDGNTSSAVEVVDDGIREGEARPRTVGAGAAILTLPNGSIAIAFQDGSSANLLLSERSSDFWQVENLEWGSHLYGFHIAAGTDAGRSLIASYHYDRTAYPSGDLVISTVP